MSSTAGSTRTPLDDQSLSDINTLISQTAAELEMDGEKALTGMSAVEAPRCC